MLEKIAAGIVGKRFWRGDQLSKLGEVYSWLTIRTLAINLVGIFIPIYLYKIGYSLLAIFGFFVVGFMVRVITDFAVGFLIARIGPKRSIGISTLLQILYLLLLLTIQELHWPLPLIAVIWATSMSTYFVAFSVGFSKIKNPARGGHELGLAYSFERIGGLIGPLIGGLIATFTDARYTLALAIVSLIISLLPIFLSPEPTQTRQKISFRQLPWHQRRSDYLAFAAFGFDNTASVILWPLLIGVVVFKEGTYAKLGLIITVSLIVALVVIRLVGRSVDRRRSGHLIRTSVLLNVLLHSLRPALLNPAGAVAASVGNESMTVGYKLPLNKGLFDAADDMPGRRIVYVASVEAIGSLAKLVFWTVLLLLAWLWDPLSAMRWIYLLVAVVSLGVLFERFVSLRSH